MRLLPFLVLGFLVYSNTLEVPFYLDDIRNIEKNPHIRLDRLTLEGLSGAAFKSFASRRPVSNISFALNYYLHEYDLAGYHAVNIVIHILTGIFLYYFLELTLRLAIPLMFSRRQPPSLNPSLIALFAALLWLVHPIQTQSVTYIVQRMNSMAAMFYILCFLFYVKGRLSAPGGRRWAWFSGSAVAALLAFGSKEISATLPFFLLLYEWYFFQDLSKAWLKRYLPYIVGSFCLLAIIALVYVEMDPIDSILSGYRHRDFTLAERLLTEFRVVIFYIGLLLYPNPSRLNLDHYFSLSKSLLEPMTTLVSLAAIIGLLALAVILARRHRLASFSILWFFGNLAIESSVISLELVFEHRAYLPSMFFFLVVIVLVSRYVRNARVLTAGFGVVLVILCLWTYDRNDLWGDPVVFWADAVRKADKKARPHQSLAVLLTGQANFENADVHYKKALAIDPSDGQLHFNFANNLAKQGRLDKAAEHYRVSLGLRPGHAQTYNGLGVVMARQGRLDEAVSYYGQALQADPDNPFIHNNMGFALARKGDSEGAARHYREALRLKPDYVQARSNLKILLGRKSQGKESELFSLGKAEDAASHAKMYLDQGIRHARQGHLDDAIARFSDALRVRTDYPEGHYSMALALSKQGKIDEAIKHYKAALRIRPNYAEAHNNLGIVLAGKGILEEAVFHFSEAVRINGDFIEARNNLEQALQQAGVNQ